MKLTTGALLLLLCPAVSTAQVNPGDRAVRLSDMLGFIPRASQNAGPQCSGGVVLDDGSMENGLRTPFASDARYVQRFTPSVYPTVVSQVCVCWKTGLDPASMGFSVTIYDDNGASGQPGTLLGSKSSTVSIPTAFGEAWVGQSCADLGIVVESGSVYLGPQWNAGTNVNFFLCTDETVTTSQATMYRSSNGGFSWTLIAQDVPETRALGVRAEFADVPKDPDPPATGMITSSQYPNFQFWVRIADTRIGTAAADCLPETVCVAGAIPTRAEVFVRIVGPKGNGYLWPNVVKFNTTKTEVWIRQISTGETRYYLLPSLAQDSETLPGLVDKTGFLP
jgi:hypothetical protein